MSVFVVSYDLNRPGQKYPELWDALENDLQGKRLQYSQWAVRADGTAKQVRDYLRAYVDDTDRLLVWDRDTGDWAATNLKTKLSKF